MFAIARVEHQELHLRNWRRCDPLRFLPTGGDLPSHPGAASRPAWGLGSSSWVACRNTCGSPSPSWSRRPRTSPRRWPRPPSTRRRRGAVTCASWPAVPGCASTATDGTRSISWRMRPASALAGFADMLRAEVAPRASGALAAAPGTCGFLLRHRHFIDSDPLVGAGVLDRALEETDGRLRDLCDALGIAPEEAPQRLDAVAVDARTRLESYHVECERLHGALRRSGIVTLPSGAAAHQRAARLPPPAPIRGRLRRGLGRRAQRHPVPGQPRAGTGAAPDALARVRGRCLSRTWGGAHLIAFAGGEAARRVPRRVAAAPP